MKKIRVTVVISRTATYDVPANLDSYEDIGNYISDNFTPPNEENDEDWLFVKKEEINE